MGGQACVFYGAAEFSRDVDLAIPADAGNLERLQSALGELQAELVHVPTLTAENLQRGHAVHFRCRHPEAMNLRVDLMAKMRGVAAFAELWERRTTLTDAEGVAYELLALPDLVQAKKTQRDKDWPMIRRLLEADYQQQHESSSEGQIRFWLKELRTAELLVNLSGDHAKFAAQLVAERPLLRAALANDLPAVRRGLEEEERREREVDEAYWRPLKAELESLRHGRLKG